MKLKISVTVNLDKERIKILTQMARDSGFGFDGTKAPGKLIRRLLEPAVTDTVTYCHEKVSKN